jgi:hypothetical protein
LVAKNGHFYGHQRGPQLAKTEDFLMATDSIRHICESAGETPAVLRGFRLNQPGWMVRALTPCQGSDPCLESLDNPSFHAGNRR